VFGRPVHDVSIYENSSTFGAFKGRYPSSDYRKFNSIPIEALSSKYPIDFEFSASFVVPTAAENRPINTVLNGYIIYC
jgi:hypothetical protein